MGVYDLACSGFESGLRGPGFQGLVGFGGGGGSGGGGRVRL